MVYHNREKVEKILESDEVVREPQDRVVEYGTISSISRGGRTISIKDYYVVEATAYCSGVEGTGCPVDERGWTQCTGPYATGHTSTGRKAIAGDGSKDNPHIIAVDPRVIPLGTLVILMD